MTKKKIKEMLASAPLLEARMTRLEGYLINILKMSTRNNILIDPNGNVFEFDNKYVFYPKDSYTDKSLIPFTPFTNLRLTTSLMGIYFAVKNVEGENTYEYTSYSLTSTQEDKVTKSQAVIKVIDHVSNKTLMLCSRWFVNESLAYIDAVLGIEKDTLYRSILNDIDNYLVFMKENRNAIAKIIVEESKAGNTPK